MPLRHQDPTTGRWNGIDPVTHFSSSTYAGYNNNPVFWADPSGADGHSFWGAIKSFFGGGSSSGMPKGYGKVGGASGTFGNIAGGVGIMAGNAAAGAITDWLGEILDGGGVVPTPLEGAKIANHIYDGKQGEVVSGWSLDRVFTDGNNPSYKAGLYSKTIDGVTGWVFANMGTVETAGSVSEDIEQPFGGSENMKRSLQDARDMNRLIGQSDLTFVGHSKGGAEAAGNALATNRNAILYNPAAINASSYGLDTKNYKGKILSYVISYEILDQMVGLFSPKIIQKIYLPLPSGSDAFDGHGINTIIDAFELELSAERVNYILNHK